jgi:PAS domain S-box-containing protein
MGYTFLFVSNSKELLDSIENAIPKEFDLFMVKSLLGYEIDRFEEQFKIHSPDLIILGYDIGLDNISQVLSNLDLSPAHNRIPVVVAFDSSTSFDLKPIIDLGIDDYIEISICLKSLADRLQMCIYRRRSINQLLQKSDQFSDISLAASQAGSSLLIIDKNGEIVWVNEGFEMLYECNLEEFREKFGKNVFESDINTGTVKAMKKCVENGEYVIYESVWFTKDNKRKNIQTSLTPIYDSAENFSKIIAIETDITDLKMAEEALSDKHDNLLSTMEHLEEANRLLDEQRNEIEKQKASLEEEKNKSDALLLNILPAVAAHQLKKKGFVKPKKYNEVSTLFADFVNFSSLSNSYDTIEEFLAALSFYFETFDEVTTKRFIEKIKTIGDCYMCVGGVPQINKSHPFDTVLAALEIQKFVEEKAAIDQAKGRPVWRLRIGIHSGSVMAGVIGKKKFAYDIWGDTVNVASRMESKGEAGKVNISETTYESVKEYFECKYRGKEHAKNIGYINMYFVERILPEYSEDEEGFIPNALFRTHLAKY